HHVHTPSVTAAWRHPALSMVTCFTFRGRMLLHVRAYSSQCVPSWCLADPARSDAVGHGRRHHAGALSPERYHRALHRLLPSRAGDTCAGAGVFWADWAAHVQSSAARSCGHRVARLMLALYQVCYFGAIALVGVAVATLVTLCSAPMLVALISTLLTG